MLRAGIRVAISLSLCTSISFATAGETGYAYFHGVCGPINLAFGGVLPRSDDKIDHMIRWNIEKTHKGSYEESAAANLFYSQDLAVILLEQGRVEEFLRMFYTVLAANISHQTLTTDEWRAATQPHIHSIASMVRMARTMSPIGSGRGQSTCDSACHNKGRSRA